MDALLHPIDWSSVADPDADGHRPSTAPGSKKTPAKLRNAEKQKLKDKRKTEKAARKKNRKR
jgi:hypothetical protein